MHCCYIFIEIERCAIVLQKKKNMMVILTCINLLLYFQSGFLTEHKNEIFSPFFS